MSEENKKTKITPAVKRNLIILGGTFTIVIVATIMLAGGKKEFKSNSEVTIPQSAAATTENQDGVQVAGYGELAKKEELKRQEQARNQNEFYLPDLNVQTQSVKTPAQLKEEEDLRRKNLPPDVLASQGTQASIIANEQEAASKKVEADREAEAKAVQRNQELMSAKQQQQASVFSQKMAAFGQLMEAQKSASAQYGAEIKFAKPSTQPTVGNMNSTVSPYKNNGSNFSGSSGSTLGNSPFRTAGQDGNGLPSNKNSATAKTLVMRAGESIYANINMSINTDEPSIVMANILGGKLSGGMIFGKAVLNSNDTVTITFDKISLPEKQQTSFSGVAIDPRTGRSSLTGTVNKKIFTRYVLPITSTIAGSYAQLLAKQSTQQTTTLATTLMPGNTFTGLVMTPQQTRDLMTAEAIKTLGGVITATSAAAKPVVTFPNDLNVEVKLTADFLQ